MKLKSILITVIIILAIILFLLGLKISYIIFSPPSINVADKIPDNSTINKEKAINLLNEEFHLNLDQNTCLFKEEINGGIYWVYYGSPICFSDYYAKVNIYTKEVSNQKNTCRQEWSICNSEEEGQIYEVNPCSSFICQEGYWEPN
jgi:hypothetical protein